MIKRITVLILTLILGSCAGLPAETPVLIPSTFTKTAMERWMVYERVLALELLGTTDAICEWEVLGNADQEVYVWAECQINDLVIGTATSVPAVLFLGKDGSVEKVQIPGDGTKYENDIRKMFPPELLEQIFSQAVDTEAMWSHLQLRHKTPEPPLVVLSGEILP